MEESFVCTECDKPHLPRNIKHKLIGTDEVKNRSILNNQHQNFFFRQKDNEEEKNANKVQAGKIDKALKKGIEKAYLEAKKKKK